MLWKKTGTRMDRNNSERSKTARIGRGWYCLGCRRKTKPDVYPAPNLPFKAWDRKLFFRLGCCLRFRRRSGLFGRFFKDSRLRGGISFFRFYLPKHDFADFITIHGFPLQKGLSYRFKLVAVCAASKSLVLLWLRKTISRISLSMEMAVSSL